MHEMSLMQSMFTMLEEESLRHGFTQITRVEVVVGELSGVEPKALEFAFQCLSQNTTAQGAEFVIIPVKVTGKCRRCGTFLEGINQLSCRCAGQPDYIMLSGTELYLNSVTGETGE